MTIFNVHIYREMRLKFDGIEADTQEAAAAIARDKVTSDADQIEDCEGESIAAVVDVQGDEDYEQSRSIDFESERQRKAAPKLLEALRISDGFVQWALDRGADSGATANALSFIRTTIAEAEAAGVASDLAVEA